MASGPGGGCRFWPGDGRGESADGTDALFGLPGNWEERRRNGLPELRGDGVGCGVSHPLGARTYRATWGIKKTWRKVQGGIKPLWTRFCGFWEFGVELELIVSARPYRDLVDFLLLFLPKTIKNKR